MALHNVNDEPVATPFLFPFEEAGTTEAELRGLIWVELSKFHNGLGPMPSSFTGK